MNSFAVRSTEVEYLDRPDIPPDELFINLKELDFINNFLGGHAATIKGIKYFIKKYKNIENIIDIGCGGGDTLGAVARWSKKNNYKINLTGIDILPEAINFANDKYGYLDNIKFICSDFNNFHPSGKYDLSINSLICHHLYKKELSEFLNFNYSVSKYGFILNDLHRHPLAYHSISLLTKLFSSSYMVKNDAPLSVKKGFKKTELENLLIASGFSKYSITWEWAFRYLVIVENDEV